MSRSSHIELRPTDFQDLGHLDSVSLLSEPPDIRNWFSSYIYESPELNTLDGFQDFDGSGETCLEEEKNGKSGDCQPVDKSDDGCAASKKKSSDGIMFNESDEFECSKSAAVVLIEILTSPNKYEIDRIKDRMQKATGSSESLSFSSEPPDIRNWFSSYFYESSPLDTTHDFAISDYKEREDGKLCNGQKSCKQYKKDLMAFIDVEESRELCSQSTISDKVVKCTNLVKDTRLDYQSVCKDVHNVALKPMQSILSQLTSDKVSDPMLSGQRTGNSNHGSVEKIGNTNTYGNDNDAKLHCSLTDRSRPISLDTENNIGSWDGTSVHKSTGRIGHVKDSQEKEDLHEIVSPGTTDMTVPKGDSLGRPTNRRSNGKENEGTELLENGFISIRKKSSQANAGNVPRLRNGVRPMINHEKDANIVRKVLSEISNCHSANRLESTGKWSCPQKNKPNVGPPLKQLRLDQWVRRV